MVGALKAGAVGALMGATVTGAVLWITPTGSPSPGATNHVPARTATTRAAQQPKAQTERAAPPVTTQPRPNVSKPRAPSVVRAPEPAAPPVAAPSALDRSNSVPGSRAAYPDAPGESVARGTPPPLSSSDRLRLESQRLAEARGLLRTGDPGAALTALNELTRDFPNGILAQERDALIVQALVAAGSPVDAGKRARAFLQRYPNSPHAADVRRALE